MVTKPLDPEDRPPEKTEATPARERGGTPLPGAAEPTAVDRATPTPEDAKTGDATRAERQHTPTDHSHTTPSMADDVRPGFDPLVDAPRRIGPYRIVEVLGEGGMGSVFLARQEKPVKREVALKLIRSSLNGPKAGIRFEAERQAMALLNHPNVAHMFEAGTTADDFPYFVMEHIPGPPITTYCDEQQLSLEERLELFEKVCDGVQHAHQKGIIHRDIKPSNILVSEVDGQPMPKIIDFGIAKALDQPLGDITQLTGGGVIGTPAYMSPEALDISDGRTDVDTRTDVYALGILLYELLTGVRPFETKDANMMQVLKRIADEDAPGPGSRFRQLNDDTREGLAEKRHTSAAGLSRRLKGDLNWITLKAIAKDRDRRYSSAAALAADVRRHLSSEPVSASPPSTLYRLSRFVRRNKMAVFFAVLTFALLIGGTIHTRYQLKTTQEAFKEAERVSNFMTEIFSAHNPAIGSLNPGEHQDPTAKVLLDEAAKRLRGNLVDEPKTRARLLRAVGNAYVPLGHTELGIPLLEEALVMHREEFGPDDPRTALILSDLGVAYLHGGDLDTAEDFLIRAKTINSDFFHPGHTAVARNRMPLAEVHLRRGHLDKAVTELRPALASFEKTRGLVHKDVALAAHRLGFVLGLQGNLQEAIPHLRSAREIWEQLLGPEHGRVAGVMADLGLLLVQDGQCEEALVNLERAEKIWSTVPSSPPLNRVQWGLATCRGEDTGPLPPLPGVKHPGKPPVHKDKTSASKGDSP